VDDDYHCPICDSSIGEFVEPECDVICFSEWVKLPRHTHGEGMCVPIADHDALVAKVRWQSKEAHAHIVRGCGHEPVLKALLFNLDEIIEGQPPSPPPPESLEHCPNPQECGDCSAPPERPFPECPTAPFTGWDDEPTEPAPKDGECQIQAMGHDCEIHGVPVEPQSLEPEPDDDDKYGEALSEGAENNQVRQRLAKLEELIEAHKVWHEQRTMWESAAAQTDLRDRLVTLERWRVIQDGAKNMNGILNRLEALEARVDSCDEGILASVTKGYVQQVVARVEALEDMHDYDFDGKDSIVGALYGRVEAKDESERGE